ncbi:MAG: hypothetical protein CMF19_09335 [Idiomarinaceae bacterium]|nr:hypothetical protein [Idiomarinaceae bacterium]
MSKQLFNISHYDYENNQWVGYYSLAVGKAYGLLKTKPDVYKYQPDGIDVFGWLTNKEYDISVEAFEYFVKNKLLNRNIPVTSFDTNLDSRGTLSFVLEVQGENSFEGFLNVV